MKHKREFYYHILECSEEKLNSILSQGLICNSEGHIFLFEDMSISGYGITNYVGDIIAHDQLFLKEYFVLRIDAEGITQELIPDNVGEYSSSCQWIAKQPVIEPVFIEFQEQLQTEYTSFYQNALKN